MLPWPDSKINLNELPEFLHKSKRRCKPGKYKKESFDGFICLLPLPETLELLDPEP